MEKIQPFYYPIGIAVLMLAHRGGLPLIGAIALTYVGFKTLMHCYAFTDWLLRPTPLACISWLLCVPIFLVTSFLILKLSQMVI